MRVKKWALMGILCGTMVLLAGCGKAQKAYKQAGALAENAVNKRMAEMVTRTDWGSIISIME